MPHVTPLAIMAPAVTAPGNHRRVRRSGARGASRSSTCQRPDPDLRSWWLHKAESITTIVGGAFKGGLIRSSSSPWHLFTVGH